MSKAFDRYILLDKLQYYGIHWTTMKLLTSYMDNTKQYVDIDGQKSDVRNIITSVPQG